MYIAIAGDNIFLVWLSLFSKLQESVIYYAATSLRKRKINDVQVAVIVIKYGDREKSWS